MGRTKELLGNFDYEEQAMEFYSRLELLRQMEEELVDPKVPQSVKRCILKTILL